MRRIAPILLSATMAMPLPAQTSAPATVPDLPEMPIAPDTSPSSTRVSRPTPEQLEEALRPRPPVATAPAATAPAQTDDAPASRPAEFTPPPPATEPVPTVETPPETRPAGLVLAWECKDHPSGLFYAKDEAILEVIAENFAPPTAAAAPLGGEIVFGLRPAGSDAPKPLAITPVAATTVAAGTRVKLAVKVSFPAPGEYVLRHDGREIPAATGQTLACIFPPRGVDAKTPDTPWITPLPPAATLSPDFLLDYCKRTGIRRFVLDETWGPVLTPEIRVLPTRQRDVLLRALADAKAQLVLRLSLAPEAKKDPKHIAAFHAYVSTFVTKGKGGVGGVCVDAGNALPQGESLERVRAYYLAAYDAAKKANKSTLMLGAGSVVNGDMFLLAPPASSKLTSLRAYVDAIAAADLPLDVRRGLERGQQWMHTPVWVLPARAGGVRVPPAALKAAGVSVIPVDPSERNVAPHLLGGAVLTERLHPDVPPHIAIFQGDGYALAAIAGLGAGTLLDADRPLGPARVSPPTVLIEDKEAKPILELADDTESMRVVDARGNSVDCRVGDMLNIPLTSQVYYVLAAGAADDIAGLLRTATPKALPFAGVHVVDYVPATAEAGGTLKLRLTNTSAAAYEASLSVWAKRLQRESGLGEAATKSIAPGKSTEVTLPLVQVDAPADVTLDITNSATRQTQRQTISRERP